MNAGQLRHRIRVQRLDDQVTASGALAERWVDRAHVWCRIEPLGGRETYREHALHGEATHRLVMRLVAGITTKDRVLFGTREFDITGIANVDERGEKLVVLVKERGT